MSLPDQTPKLPKLPFLVGDAALLAAAWLIAEHARGPLTAYAVAGVTGCVALGALLGVIPFLTDYARSQDEALDERQRGLEALSRTVNTAAEQISIAAGGLHEIAELAHKNLKHAEQLPHRLHEKITEFNAQLDNAREDDREELERELAELRASESERLQAVADKVQRAVSDLAKLDTAVQKHLTARSEFVERVNDTLTKSHADATVALNEAVTAVTRELTAAQAGALAKIDAKFAERTAAALAAIEAASAAALAAAPAPVAASVLPPAASQPPAEGPAPDASLPDAPLEVASPPKRPRKSRREEPIAAVAEPAASPTDLTAPNAPSAPEPATPPVPAETAAAASAEATPPTFFSEPAPVPAETIAQVEPVAPASADPFPPTTAVDDGPAPIATAADPAAPPLAPPPEIPPPPAPPVNRPARKRAPRKPETEPTADLPLQLAGDEPTTSVSEETPITRADAFERMISSDGATRLIATAYIGIGNRLFIRGDGPGLSWEKGVPLQFVSIGKWRWETAGATAPIDFKLYKNDETECIAPGKLSLDPGYQHEVAARF